MDNEDLSKPEEVANYMRNNYIGAFEDEEDIGREYLDEMHPDLPPFMLETLDPGSVQYEMTEGKKAPYRIYYQEDEGHLLFKRRTPANDAEWDESKHPRDKGKFASVAGGEGGTYDLTINGEPWKTGVSLAEAAKAAQLDEHEITAMIEEHGKVEVDGDDDYGTIEIKVRGDHSETMHEPPVRIKGRDNVFMACDSIVIDKGANVKRTSDGYISAEPRVARTGIQVYRGRELGRDDMEYVRVYRPEKEVFDKRSLRSYAHRPVTNDHPPEAVNRQNWKQYAVGHTADGVARDGECVRVPVLLMDSQAIQDFDDGKCELSLGYTMELDWKKGVTKDGQQYDAVQRNIRANHLALVAAARGGPQLRLGDNSLEEKTMKLVLDGISVEVSDRDGEVIKREVKRLSDAKDAFEDRFKKKDEECEDSKKKLATADAQIVTLTTQLKEAKDALTPAKIDQLVKDHAACVGLATVVMKGKSLTTDGKTISEIKRQVVDALVGDAARGWSDDVVSGSFATLTAGVKPLAKDTLAHVLSNNGSRVTVNDALEQAYEARDKALTEAWRGDKKTA